MQMTIELPDDLEAPLRRVAQAQHRSAQDVALDILRAGLLDNLPELDTIVADIRAAAPNPAALRPARGSLLAALDDAPADNDLDLAAWQDAWTSAEAEMAALSQADDRAEGR